MNKIFLLIYTLIVFCQCSIAQEADKNKPLPSKHMMTSSKNILSLNIDNCRRPSFSSDFKFFATFHLGYLTAWSVNENTLVQLWSQESIPNTIITDFCWSGNNLVFGIVNDINPLKDQVFSSKGTTTSLNMETLKETNVAQDAYLQYVSDSSKKICAASPTGRKDNDFVIDFYSFESEKFKAAGRYVGKNQGKVKYDSQFVSTWNGEKTGVFACLSNKSGLSNYVYIDQGGEIKDFLPNNALGFPSFKLGIPMPVVDYSDNLHMMIAYFGATPAMLTFKNLRIEKSTIAVSINSYFSDLYPSVKLVTTSPNGKFYIIKGSATDGKELPAPQGDQVWAIDTSFEKRKLLCELSNDTPIEWTKRGLLWMSFSFEKGTSQYHIIDFPEGYMDDKEKIQESLNSDNWHDVPVASEGK